MLKLPRAVIFDCDGVLVDATEIHYESLNRALNLFGFDIKREDHLSLYNGLPTKKKLEMLTESRGLPISLHNVIQKQKQLYTQYLIRTKCKAEYGKLIMLNNLKSQNIKIACCSNAIKSSVVEMLELSGMLDYFQLILGNDSIEGMKPKPDPQIYLEAIQMLKENPEDIWIVEDAPHGIEAAKAAGVGRVIEVKGYQEVNLNLFL